MDERGDVVNTISVPGFARSNFLRGEYAPGVHQPEGFFIQQESTFWRRSLWEKAGGSLDLTFRLAGDFDLWARFFRHAPLYGLQLPLAVSRTHVTQRSRTQWETYRSECASILAREGATVPTPAQQRLRRVARATPQRVRKGLSALGLWDAAHVVASDFSGGWVTFPRLV